MEPCITAKYINKSLREKLPVITPNIYRNHFCNECRFYAGRENKTPHCMLIECPWDGQKPIADPILMELLPGIEMEYKKAEMKFQELAAVRNGLRNLLEDPIKREKKKSDGCYKCPYGQGKACIGYCYVQNTSNPREECREGY